jgi:hypothetical protein
MAEITEKLVASSNLVVDESTKKVLSYYEKASDIIKRTHVAMGRGVIFQPTNIASTIHGKIDTSNHSRTH